MHQFSNDERKVIVKALFEQRKNFDGTDEQFAQSFGINYSVYSRLKSVSDYSSLLSAAKWADVAYELQVDFKKSKWIVGKTDVYAMIEEEVLFCKKYAKSRICVESSDIGKTTAAKHLAATYKNIFYIDVSQCPGKIEFIRTLAKKLGINPDDKIANLRAKTKYQLKVLPDPIIILDEAGDAKYETFLLWKEYWNGTEGTCGWYMIGADALRDWIERGKKNRKVGFYEMFNRYGGNYTTIIPFDPKEKAQFYKKLITDVVRLNVSDKSKVNEIVAKALRKNEDTGEYSGLRRIDSLILLHTN